MGHICGVLIVMEGIREEEGAAGIYLPSDKSAYQKIIFLISKPKHMLWVLKRTVSMRRFF